jgi:hypothetical protein
MDIKSLLKSKQSQLESKLSILLDHPTTKGEHCESAWIDFFRSFLPSRYSVDKGFVFDCRGNVSEQIDIIIYDALYSPLIFGTDAGEKFITAESVYAVFDSKPKIDKNNLEYTNHKIESVVKLHRTSREIINAGRVMEPRKLTHIIGGILAVDSIAMKPIEEYLMLYSKIDIGCAIKNFSFTVDRDDNRVVTNIRFSSSDEVVLSFFYMILNLLYIQGTVAAIDIRDYANATLDSLELH